MIERLAVPVCRRHRRGRRIRHAGVYCDCADDIGVVLHDHDYDHFASGIHDQIGVERAAH